MFRFLLIALALAFSAAGHADTLYSWKVRGVTHYGDQCPPKTKCKIVSTTPQPAPVTDPTPQPAPVIDPTPQPEAEAGHSSPSEPIVAKRTFYVDGNSGSDSNAGTSTAPWRTIARANQSLVAGDMAYIRAGTYRERIVPRNSGSASGGYIIYAAYPGETVTLDGTGLFATADWAGLVHIVNRNYVQVRGLRVVNSPGFGFYIRPGNNIRILGNVAYNSHHSSIRADGDTITIDGNDFGRSNVGSQEAVTLNATNFVVSNNKVHGGLKEGICIKRNSQNGKIFGNDVHNMLRVGIYLGECLEARCNIEVFGNIVRDPNPATDGTGYNGIRIGSEYGVPVSDIKVYNNIVYSMKSTGIILSQYADPGYPVPRMQNISIVNNTVYGNGTLRGGGIAVEGVHGTNIVVASNIVSQNSNFSIAVDPVVRSQVLVTDNLIDKVAGQGTRSDETFGAHAVIASPRFVNAAAREFRLQSSSPAIDRADPMRAPATDFARQPRPVGSGPDIGAHEWR